MHVVQLGYDDSVFRVGAPSDTLKRQLDYGRVLAELRPGAQMTFLAFSRNRGARAFQRENVRFVPVPGGRVAQPIALIRALAAIHRRQPINVVSSQSPFEDGWATLAFGKVYRVPVIAQIHYDIFSPFAARGGSFPLLSRARTALGIRSLRHFTAIRCVGNGIKRAILDRGLHHAVSVIPVPVTMTPKERDANPSRVLYVGRLDSEKRMRDWLHVAAAVLERRPETAFDIVGNGADRADLEDLARSLGIADRVRFHGFVPYERLPDFYRRAAVFLLTSSYEGFGRVLVEAQLHGIPCVSTRTLGAQDVIEHDRTGFLHDVGDIRGMAESVARLLDDRDTNTHMGREGAALVREKFDPAALARQWMELLANVADHP